MSEENLNPSPVLSTPETNFQTILELTSQACSPGRKALLGELLNKVKALFEKAPASTSKTYHDAEEGGLINHILHVHKHLVDLAKPYQAQFPEELSAESLWTVCLLHDIRKVCDATLQPYYVDNILKSGKLSKDKPFKTNDAYLSAPELDFENVPPILRQAYLLVQTMQRLQDGTCSLSLIQTLSPILFENLSEQEKKAILWHEGGYGDAKYYANGREPILQILLHAADMLASRWNRLTNPQTPVEREETA